MFFSSLSDLNNLRSKRNKIRTTVVAKNKYIKMLNKNKPNECSTYKYPVKLLVILVINNIHE